jgi:threonine/homoserine/homoserine lactone efflux protein
MPDGSTLLLFAGASLALLAIPGPAVIYVVTRSLDQGRAAGIVSMLGVETGTFAYALAAAAGLTGLIAASATAFTVVRYAGAAYLLVLAARALRSGAAVQPAAVPAGRTFRQAFLVGISNPKVAVFFLAFLPQFGSSSRQFLLLGLVFLAVAVTVDLGWALLSGQLGRWLRRHPGLLRRQRFVTAPVYAALAGYAATS